MSRWLSCHILMAIVDDFQVDDIVHYLPHLLSISYDRQINLVFKEETMENISMHSGVSIHLIYYSMSATQIHFILFIFIFFLLKVKRDRGHKDTT